MANVTPDILRGILIPKAQITKDNIWKSESSFSQANSRAGIPNPQQVETGLVLSCIGEQAEDITVETTQGGLPGEAGFTWKGTDNVQIGKNHSNLITDAKYFAYASVPGYRHVDCIGDNLGNLYFVTELLSGTTYTIKLYKQAKNGSVVDKKTFFVGSVTTSTEAHPMITQLSDGSILVAYFNYTDDDYINLIVWRSYDLGDTWTQISSRALLGQYNIFVGTGGDKIGKTNMITVNNNVVIVMELISQGALGGNDALTWVSRDQGTTFRSIRATSSVNYHEISAIALDDGQYSITYLSDERILKNLIVPDISIFFGGDFESDKAVEISNGVLSFCQTGTNPGGGSILEDGSMTSWYQDGRIYVAAKEMDNNIVGWVSSDLGQTWDYIAGAFTPTATSGAIYNAQTTAPIRQLKSCLWEGYAILMGQANNSILGLYLGGYSSVTMPGQVDQPDYWQYFYYNSSWVAHFSPELSTNWNTAGAGTKTLTSTGLRVQTSNNTRYFTYAGALLRTEQIMKFSVQVDSGGNFLSDYIAVVKTTSNASNAYTFRMRFTTSGFVIRDHSSLLHTENVTMTDYIEFMVSLKDADCDVYWRKRDEKQAKKWNKISVTLGAQALGPAPSLQWGHIVTYPLTSDSRWLDFHMGIDSIDDSVLRSATYPPFGRYTYVDQGLNLTAKESPAREGDQYSIVPRYDFPLDNIFHQIAQSPRIVWRSEDDASNQTIGILMDAINGANEASLELNDVAGLHLSNINFETFILQLWDIGTMAWVDHITVNVSDGLTGTFQRRGNTIEPGATGNPFYLHYGECKGWRAILGTGDNAKIVKLKTNSEGVWGTNSTDKRAVLMIDTDDGLNVFSLPTSGSIKLIPDSITVISEMLQTTKPGQEAFAIKIPVQDTVEGYFQIGAMIWGHVAFMAPQYQRGRSISYEPNIQEMTTLDNSFHSRRLSDGARVFQIAWTEPIDTRNIMSSTPDYWQLSTTVGSQPVANYGDSPFQMMGIWDYLGNQYPAVYLPVLKKGQDTQILNRYHEHAYIRPTGALTIESVLGEEQQDELFRVATITLMEIE